MFQQSRRTKSSNQMILSFQNWFAIYDFLHILRKLQILSISVVLTEQISSGADHFSYLVPWIPFTNLKFMRATDWFKNPRNFKWLIWFLPFWKGWFFKALKKSLLPPKRDPAKVIEKMKKNIIKPFHHRFSRFWPSISLWGLVCPLTDRSSWGWHANSTPVRSSAYAEKASMCAAFVARPFGLTSAAQGLGWLPQFLRGTWGEAFNNPVYVRGFCWGWEIWEICFGACSTFFEKKMMFQFLRKRGWNYHVRKPKVSSRYVENPSSKQKNHPC